MFPKGDVPKWVREALEVAGIDLTGIATVPLDQLGAPAAPSAAEGGADGEGPGPAPEKGAEGKEGQQQKGKRRGRAQGPSPDMLAAAKEAKAQAGQQAQPEVGG